MSVNTVPESSAAIPFPIPPHPHFECAACPVFFAIRGEHCLFLLFSLFLSPPFLSSLQPVPPQCFSSVASMAMNGQIPGGPQPGERSLFFFLHRKQAFFPFSLMLNSAMSSLLPALNFSFSPAAATATPPLTSSPLPHITPIAYDMDIPLAFLGPVPSFFPKRTFDK